MSALPLISGMLFNGQGTIKINKQLSETIPSVKCVVAIKNYQIRVDNAWLVTYEVIKELCTVGNAGRHNIHVYLDVDMLENNFVIVLFFRNCCYVCNKFQAQN